MTQARRPSAIDAVAEDRTLGVLPLSFDYGQNQLLSTWAAGGEVIPIEYLSARDVIRAVERHDVTTLAGVPPLWVQLIEAVWPPRAALASFDASDWEAGGAALGVGSNGTQPMSAK